MKMYATVKRDKLWGMCKAEPRRAVTISVKMKCYILICVELVTVINTERNTKKNKKNKMK